MMAAIFHITGCALPVIFPDQREGSDITAVNEKRISVTPVNLDWTHEEFRSELGSILETK